MRILHTSRLLIAFGLVLMMVGLSHARAQSYEGQGILLNVTIAPDGQVRGQFQLKGNRYPLTATADASGAMRGTFQAGGNAFEFTTTPAPDGLILRTGQGQFALKRSQAAPPAPPAQRGAAGAPQIVMQRHVLKDPGSNNMDSHVLLAPKGWEVQGKAHWAHPNYFNIHPSQDITITSPEGLRVRIAPSFSAKDNHPSPQFLQMGVQRPREGQADNGLPVMYLPMDEQQWRQALTQRVIPAEYPKARNIRLEEFVTIPELTQLMQQQVAPLKHVVAEQNREAAMLGLGMQSNMDARFLAASYKFELDGRQYEELAIFGLLVMITDTEMGRNIFWAVDPSVAFRAPAGQLEASMPLLMAISNSVRPTPQWAKMKADHIATMNNITAKGAADRAKIWADTNREINRMINEGYESRIASQDRSHEQFIRAIRGVENYSEPGTSTQVQLPNNYNHVYTNSAGEYILTNDPLYNPNLDPAFNNHNWNGMEVAK
jgi:hypothetical protein